MRLPSWICCWGMLLLNLAGCGARDTPGSTPAPTHAASAIHAAGGADPEPAAVPAPPSLLPASPTPYPLVGDWNNPTPTMIPLPILQRTGRPLRTLWGAGASAPTFSTFAWDSHDGMFGTLWTWQLTPPFTVTQGFTLSTPLDTANSFFGTIAPTTGALAYRVADTASSSLLRMPAGSAQPVVLATAVPGALAGIAWSPDGVTLAALRSWADPTTGSFGSEVVLYGAAPQPPRTILRAQHVRLLGWDGPDALLMQVAEAGDPSSWIERLTPTTGIRQRLAPVGPGGEIILSPNRRYALCRDNGEVVILDLQTGQRAVLKLPAGIQADRDHAVWRADSTAVLFFPATVEEPAVVFRPQGDLLEANATLTLDPGFEHFSVRAALGQYLVVCSSRDRSPSATDHQTSIYDMLADRWQVIDAHACLQVVEWR